MKKNLQMDVRTDTAEYNIIRPFFEGAYKNEQWELNQMSDKRLPLGPFL